MADIITLSSEDEEESVIVPKKRIKLTTVCNTTSDSKETESEENPFIVVLDDDDDDCNDIKNGPKAAKIEETPKPEVEPMETPEPEPELEEIQIGTKDDFQLKCSSISDKLDSSQISEETSEDPDIENEFFAFLDDCVQMTRNPEHQKLLRSKLPIIKKFHVKLKKLTYDPEEFREIIKNNMETIQSAPEQTIICFKDVFEWLKSNYKDAMQGQKTADQNQKIIKKLNKALSTIRRKIAELEKAEINFDDEEDSSYLQMHRYMQRASQIYKKLCHYRDENPNHGRLLYCRLDFSASKYSEINKAINKKYKNNKVFPMYYDIDKCVRKCVRENNLAISEDSLKYEIKHCFENLGKLMQRRRKLDLYDTQKSYILDTVDPALKNPVIECKLRAHRSEADKKLEQVFEKYSRLQEKGVNPKVSSESEDSDVVESASECEQDENVTENI